MTTKTIKNPPSELERKIMRYATKGGRTASEFLVKLYGEGHDKNVRTLNRPLGRLIARKELTYDHTTGIYRKA